VNDVDQTDTPRLDGLRPEREPLFRAPWTIVVLPLLLIALYASQRATLSTADEAFWALTPGALAAGRWYVLLTCLFLHRGWVHVLMNSIAILAFGPPAARLLGTDSRGAATFFGFYLACGVLAGLGFILVDHDNRDVVVGASGAVSGLLGAASRIIEGRGQIGPMFGRTVLGMAAAWVIVNVALGPSGFTPGAAGIPVAWQAHLAGYAAGVLMIGAFARLAGASDAAFTQ
jgi:membrane associated rhomboid family serine protease